MSSPREGDVFFQGLLPVLHGIMRVTKKRPRARPQDGKKRAWAKTMHGAIDNVHGGTARPGQRGREG